VRIGHGYDIHRLVPDRPLVLAGVELHYDLGLQGHSDADVISHAVTDALLGAAGLGDIGSLFPNDDPQWKDARSAEMLRNVVARLSERGLRVISVDITVVLEVPKLGPYRDAMLAQLSGALGLATDRIGLKAKTNEGLGPVGAGEAIAAFAVALLDEQPA
jgi:2-C-methyl-D-erythritol 2,4-cyclodiphosphate synthase